MVVEFSVGIRFFVTGLSQIFLSVYQDFVFWAIHLYSIRMECILSNIYIPVRVQCVSVFFDNMQNRESTEGYSKSSPVK